MPPNQETPEERLQRLEAAERLARRLAIAYEELGTETEKLRESEIALAKATVAVAQERLKQEPTNQE